MQIVRTSFAFPAPFYNRLLTVSKQRQLSLTQTIQDLLEIVLKQEEDLTRRKIYAAFKRVKGICKDPVTDASQTIDETLYGEHKGEKNS